jgi:exodeoxyribonuclease VII large subunit
VDTTLCDLAADVRAPTPTAAAELVVPKVADLLASVAELERRLHDIDRWLQPRMQRVDELSLRLDSRLVSVVQHAQLRIKAAEAMLSSIRPSRVIELLSSRVEVLLQRLRRAGSAALQLDQRTVGALSDRLARLITSDSLERRGLQLEALARRLSANASRRMEVARADIGALEARLMAIDPARVLSRGFSIVSVGGRPVRSIAEVQVGGRIEVTMSDGVASGTVSEVKEEKRWQNR